MQIHPNLRTSGKKTLNLYVKLSEATQPTLMLFIHLFTFSFIPSFIHSTDIYWILLHVRRQWRQKSEQDSTLPLPLWSSQNSGVERQSNKT